MPSPVNFLIAHGTLGHPQENWFPWMARELEKDGRVFVPQLPTPEGQLLDAWTEIAERALAGCDPGNTVLIGHSAGAVLVLHLAARAKTPFKAVFSVSPFTRRLGFPQFDPYVVSFVDLAFDWPAVRAGGRKFFCVAGDDDPYVPLAQPREIAKGLNTELIVIEKGGHLNEAAGYLQFPRLLEMIREVAA